MGCMCYDQNCHLGLAIVVSTERVFLGQSKRIKCGRPAEVPGLQATETQHMWMGGGGGGGGGRGGGAAAAAAAAGSQSLYRADTWWNIGNRQAVCSFESAF